MNITVYIDVKSMGIHPNDIQLYLFWYNVNLPIKCIEENLMNWALQEVLN